MASFDDFYDTHKAHVFRFACALCRDAREAEDLFQETWLRAIKAAPDGPGPRAGQGRAWLFAIAANAHRDLLRKSRVRRLFLRERSRSLADRAADADPGWDVPHASLGEGAARSDVRLCLRRAVSRLSEKERRVFVLKDVEGFRHEEIARTLGLPEATVRTLLHRAVVKLRREMAGFGPAAGPGPALEEGRT